MDEDQTVSGLEHLVGEHIDLFANGEWYRGLLVDEQGNATIDG